MGGQELDQELVQRAQQGDKRAFGLLVGKHQHRLSRLISRIVRNHGDVEDIVQETFIKAYRGLTSFRGESAFYTWLYRIGTNVAKNHLMSLKRQPQIAEWVETEDAEGLAAHEKSQNVATPESELMSKQIAQVLNRSMADLTEDLRTALQLREIEGLSYDEIATAMDCPVGTVRSRIFRAREKIAEDLRPLLDTAKDRRW